MRRFEQVWKNGDRTYLLVTRYDRQHIQTHRHRLHQEDFCQALNKPPSAKYERNQSGLKGPRLADMFGLIDQHMTATDKLQAGAGAFLQLLFLSHFQAHDRR